MNPVRRLSDSARDVLAVVDEFGHAWEGGTTRNIRSEKLGRTAEVTPPPVRTTLTVGIVVIAVGLFLLLAWS